MPSPGKLLTRTSGISHTTVAGKEPDQGKAEADTEQLSNKQIFFPRHIEGMHPGTECPSVIGRALARAAEHACDVRQHLFLSRHYK